MFISPGICVAGDLVPPGSPDSTMKTLDEVEARIAIHEIPFTISEPGSYYLVHNLGPASQDSHGIVIEVSDVSLDLNGFALIGPGKDVGTGGSGIYSGLDIYNLKIENGTIRDWRSSGITISSIYNSVLENLRCYKNGGAGIYTPGYNSSIKNNVCMSNGQAGIYLESGNTIAFNVCRWNATYGIRASDGNTILNNTCFANSDDGLNVNWNNLIHDNNCLMNNGDGIEMFSQNRVEKNNCGNNGSLGTGAGIRATGTDNHITDNLATYSDWGMKIDGANNIISDNITRGNSTPIAALAGNQLDVLISELPFTINFPGKYRLTGRLNQQSTGSHGITIIANNVTLDLDGQSLVGPGKDAGTLDSGIYVDQAEVRTNIIIRNGTVRDWPSTGVDGFGADNSRYEKLHCMNNGHYGLLVGHRSIALENCCENNTNNGMHTMFNTFVKGNSSTSNGGNGILVHSGCTVIQNNSVANTYDGILTYSGCLVIENTCHGNSDDGIETDHGCTVKDNVSFLNKGDGIEVEKQCLVRNNNCTSNGFETTGGAGIRITDEGGCVEGNLVGDNDYGIVCNPATGNYIAGNRAHDNGSGPIDNYDILTPGNTEGTGDLVNISF
jgi:parallel beta-helix repeat protein